MERFQLAVVTMLAGLACIVSAFAGLDQAADRTSRLPAPAVSTDGAAAQRTDQAERLTVSEAQLQTPREAPPLITVAFRSGLLSVKARGAPLSEVLAAITRSVHVKFTFGSDADRPISADLGPGPTREVISSLLDGASYGYAFVGSARGPEAAAPEEVLLIRRGAAGASTRRPEATTAWAPSSAWGLPNALGPTAPPDEAALRQQRAVDALFDACRAQGCDTS